MSAGGIIKYVFFLAIAWVGVKQCCDREQAIAAMPGLGYA